MSHNFLRRADVHMQTDMLTVKITISDQQSVEAAAALNCHTTSIKASPRNFKVLTQRGPR